MRHKQITEVSIDDEDLDVEFFERVSVYSNVIDWRAGAIFTKMLTKSTTLTFTNIEHAQNKVITLLVEGDYALAFPSTVKIISGTYDGRVENYIQIHCVRNIAPREEYWATISQEA